MCKEEIISRIVAALKILGDRQLMIVWKLVSQMTLRK